MVGRDQYFNSQHNRVVCRLKEIFFSPMGLLDLVV
jgi:hypothetical protein